VSGGRTAAAHDQAATLCLHIFEARRREIVDKSST
jgi:hypothetical protein